MTVRIYRWDDVDAPQLPTSGSNSNAVAVLKACLVDGYGTRTPSGWSVEWEGTNQISLKMADTRGFVCVLDDTYYYNGCRIYGGTSSTSVDDIEGKYPQLITDNYYAWLLTRYNSTATGNKWVVIASDSWFYYFNMSHSTPQSTFFGLYEHADPLNTGNLVIAAYRDSLISTSESGSFATLFETTPTSYHRYTYTDVWGMPAYENAIQFPKLAASSSEAFSPYDGTLITHRMEITDVKTLLVMGHLPNVFRPSSTGYHVPNGYYDLPADFFNAGKKYLSVGSTSASTYGNLIMEYDE